jgi:hypothetical protein
MQETGKAEATHVFSPQLLSQPSTSTVPTSELKEKSFFSKYTGKVTAASGGHQINATAQVMTHCTSQQLAVAYEFRFFWTLELWKWR